MVQSHSLLELFAGIGGMRVAAEEIGLIIDAIHPFEINPSALEAYCHHFSEKAKNASYPDRVVHNQGCSLPGCDPTLSKTCKKIKLANIRSCKLEKMRARNLLGLTRDEWMKLDPDWLTMSPPCQPFTRQGLRLDTADARTDSLQHVLALLRDVSRPPSRILLENVKGFETSCARGEVLQVLRAKGYTVKEFLLCPSQLGVPNSRLRYYLLAALTHSSGCRDEAEVPPTNEEVSLAFPLCLCLPWVQKAEENSCAGTTKTCRRCGKPMVPKASILLEKFHSDSLKECNDSGVPNQWDAHHPPAFEYSDVTPTLAHYLHSVRMNAEERCGFCTESPKNPSCPGAHQAAASRDIISKYAETLVPVDLGRAVGVSDSSVSVVVASLNADGESSKSLHVVSTSSEDKLPSAVLSCDGYCRYRLKEKLLTKYGRLLDVVDDASRKTCCFTKSYGRLVEGTGSVFNPCCKTVLDEVFSRVGELDKYLGKNVPCTSKNPIPSSADESDCSATIEQHQSDEGIISFAAPHPDIVNGRAASSADEKPTIRGKPTQTHDTANQNSNSRPPPPSCCVEEHTSSGQTKVPNSCTVEQMSAERAQLLLSLGLRYFSPQEALCLMGFPERFVFPDHLSCRQQQQLIGNSVNVLVVAVLMAVLEQTRARER